MKAPHPCSSTTSGQDDAPQNRSQLARGAWQLLPLLVCGPGLVKFYALPLGTQVALANMASRCLSVGLLGLCVLCCSSLRVGGGLTPNLARKLCIEVLLRIRRALWQLLTIAWGPGLRQFATLMHRACHCMLRLLWHFKRDSSLVLLPVTQWAYYSLASFHGENNKALGLPLRAVLQQVAVSLLVRGLDRLWVAVGWVGRAMRGRAPRPPEWARLRGADSKDLDAVTAIRPATPIPFSQPFLGPDAAALSRLPPVPISLCLMVGDKVARGQEGGCGFGATQVPVSIRFQNSRTSKVAFRCSSRQGLAQQVKATCVLIILLYIYAVSLFVQNLQ